MSNDHNMHGKNFSIMYVVTTQYVQFQAYDDLCGFNLYTTYIKTFLLNHSLAQAGHQ